MAAEGYPGRYQIGTEIKGVREADDIDGVFIFHSGTKSENGRLFATGGRVLGVTTKAKTVAAAQKLAYKAVAMIDWPDGFNRKDIGWRAINR
jgi:phosphoribosylamine--glycine ligase